MSEHRPARSSRPPRHLAPVPSPGSHGDLVPPIGAGSEPDDLLVAGFVALHAELEEQGEVDGLAILWLVGPTGALVGAMANPTGWPVVASVVPLLAAEAADLGAASVVATIHLGGARRPTPPLARSAHRFARAMGAARMPVRAVARVDVPITFLPPWTSRATPA